MRRHRRAFLSTVGGAAVALAGCPLRPADNDTNEIATGSAASTSTSEERTVDAPPGATGYTHIRPDGNRLVAGAGSAPDVAPIDISLDRPPAWLVSVPLTTGSLWVSVAADGRTRAFRVAEGAARETAVRPNRLPAGMPPLLFVEAGVPTLATPPSADASTVTHPIRHNEELVFVGVDGDLVVLDEDTLQETGRLRIDALPDARLVAAGDRIGVLSAATDRYDHGVLGDGIEAGGVTIVDPGGGSLTVDRRISLDKRVIEGFAPMLAGVTESEGVDIIVTESDMTAGARVVVYAGSDRLAGPSIGTGNRWRHQLAVAPFGPTGETELAVVRTPHIGGVVEFYRPAEGTLEVVATAEGYATHVIGSRNLDGGLAGDLDGDGRVELLVPTQERAALVGLRRTGSDVSEVWRLAIDGEVSSNLSATRTGAGGIAVGVGHDADGIRIWPDSET